MKILVTGGCGYIGSHTALALIKEGYELLLLDDLSNSSAKVLDRIEELSGKRPRLKVMSLLEEEALRQLMEEEAFDAVLHFAGFKAVGESTEKPLAYYENNVVSSINLLKAMRAGACHCLVFSSSATVYAASSTPPPLAENLPLGSTSPYGRSKLMIEEIIRDFCAADPNFSSVLLRYFNPVGAHPSGLMGEDPQGPPNNLMPYITQVAVGKRPKLYVFGDDFDTPDGTGIRDYIHVEDLAEGHVAALRYALADRVCEAINLGTGNGHSVLEVVQTFEKANKLVIPYEVLGRRPGDQAIGFADVTKAKRLLGWEAKRDLWAMCEDAWRWQSEHPEGYDA